MHQESQSLDTNVAFLYARIMTKPQKIRREALQMSLADRMELASLLWESVEREAEQPSLPRWQREILTQRLAEDDADPEGGAPWNEVKQRILASL